MVKANAKTRSIRRRGTLAKKLLRDLRENAMQIIAMILLCFLGTWVFSGLDGTWRLMDLTVETYFEECELADFWVNAASFSQQDLDRIRHTPGVRDIQARTSLIVNAERLGEDVEVALEIYEGAFRISTPYLRSGSMLQPSDIKDCLMEEQFAQAHGLELGTPSRSPSPGSRCASSSGA